jgi:hypothetical protein
LKRTVTEVLRRGFDSTIANWQVVALRVAESVVIAVIVIASILAAVVPAVVAAGLSKDDIVNSGDPASAVFSWVIDHAILFVWIFALGFLVFGLMIALHSFIEGGAAQVYIDAERAAQRRNGSARDDFRAFSIDRWLAGGMASWWRIFWLYNLAWSVSLILVLVPLTLTIIGMLAVSDKTSRLIIGCSGVALSLLILIPVGIVTSIWCTKAIAICVSRAVTAREALRLGWTAFRTDLGRHLAVALILFVISMALSSVVSGLSIPMTIVGNKAPTIGLMFAPVRIITSVVQGIFSAAISSCLLACFVSMTEER